MSVKTLLDYRSLKAMYESEKASSSIPTPFTEMFFVNPTDEETDDFTMIVDNVEQRPAPLNNKGGKARVLDKSGAKERRGVLFHVFNVLPFGAELLDAIREPDSQVIDRKSTREARRQLAKFARRHAILKEVVLSKIITDGVVYYDVANGVVKESSGDADSVAIDFGVAASHKGNLDGMVSGQVSSASFGLHKLIEDIKLKAEEENVAPPTEVLCHPSMKQYLRGLTEFQTYVTASYQDAEQVLRGETIENLFGMNWHFIAGRYQDSAGTNVPTMDPKKLVFLPAVSEGFVQASNGKVLVPRDLDLHSDGLAALASLAEVYGEYAYATVTHNPVGIEAYAGDCYGLNFVEPNAIWQAAVLA